MGKETIANKIARKAFNSRNAQKSWAVHMKAFGPILEPAFAEDYKAKVQLMAALNQIGKRNIAGGMKKLQKLSDFCASDADKAAWFYFMGLAFEMAGEQDTMLDCYQQAGIYRHHFYLPFLKVAQSAHADATFEAAEENYRMAIRCFEDGGKDEQEKTVLSSAYINLASCLTMMHRYQDAMEALNQSKKIKPNHPGRSATAAILYAAMGDGDKAEEYMGDAADQTPAMMAETRKMVDEILNGTHPQFFSAEINPDSLETFWSWFVENQATLIAQIEHNKFEEFFSAAQAQLKMAFPFMERALDMGVAMDNGIIQITFVDYYMVSLHDGYEKLIDLCPAVVRERWNFEVAH